MTVSFNSGNGLNTQYGEVSFDSTSLAILVTALIGSVTSEVVFQDGAFAPTYATSTYTAITGGYRFIIRRSGGWLTSFSLKVSEADGGTATYASTAGSANVATGNSSLTASDLASQTGLVTGQVVETVGRSAPRGGGRWRYIYSAGATDTPNGITVISAPGGRLKADHGGIAEISLMRAGCNGSGSADCSATFSAALTAALDIASETNSTSQKVVKLKVDGNRRFRFDSPLSVPGNNTFRIEVEGHGARSVIQRYYGHADWNQADFGIAGSVLLCAPGVTLLNASNGTSVPDISLKDLAIVGINGAGVRKGVVEAYSAPTHAERVIFANLDTGWERSIVSTEESRDVRAIGCQIGFDFGGTDHSYGKLWAQNCDIGLRLSGQSMSIAGGLWQNCLTGLYLWGIIDNHVFTRQWFEANVNYNVFVGTTTQMHDVDMGCCRFSSTPAPITIPGGAWTFRRCRSGPNVVLNGGILTLEACQDAYGTINGGSVWGHHVGSNGGVSIVSDVIAPDWLTTGEQAVVNGTVLSSTGGTVTINAPTNMPYGAKWQLSCRQPAGGGIALAFSGVEASAYSNTGNTGSKDLTIVISRDYPRGFYVSYSSGWK